MFLVFVFFLYRPWINDPLFSRSLKNTEVSELFKITQLLGWPWD